MYSSIRCSASMCLDPGKQPSIRRVLVGPKLDLQEGKAPNCSDRMQELYRGVQSDCFTKVRFTRVSSRFSSRPMNAELALHEDIRLGVGQPERNQASPDEHGRGHEDGDGLCDADERAENQVPQDRCQLTQSVAEAEACSSGERRIRDRRRSKGEVEGEVFDALVVVQLHFGRIVVCLEVFDDIREPD
ncbi:hypothetical protein EYF80_015511 [Liparis tanakae]|uniref:Uncharacterized protein n=1 Tax=Liparis tanakae TaxID=230148 RepID=A0A4Z2I8I1_9TELE|nr:hypothetical protein EYF80_015511 [Liparis tanakae]